MKIIIYLFLIYLLCSCKNKETENIPETSTIINDVDTLAEINFDLKDYTYIKNYKNINLESSLYNFDKYLLRIDSIAYYTCYSDKSRIEDLHESFNSFTLETKTARINFNSVEDDEAYLRYQYINDLESIGYHLITAWTIDTPITIF